MCVRACVCVYVCVCVCITSLTDNCTAVGKLALYFNAILSHDFEVRLDVVSYSLLRYTTI